MSICTNVTSKQITDLIEKDLEKQPGLQANLVTISGVEVYGPSGKGKYKDVHRLKLNCYVPKDIIIGEQIIDFRGFLVLQADKNRFVEDHRKQD